MIRDCCKRSIVKGTPYTYLESRQISPGKIVEGSLWGGLCLRSWAETQVLVGAAVVWLAEVIVESSLTLP